MHSLISIGILIQSALGSPLAPSAYESREVVAVERRQLMQLLADAERVRRYATHLERQIVAEGARDAETALAARAPAPRHWGECARVRVTGDATDTDDDGLADVVEATLGTDPGKADAEEWRARNISEE